jgi:glycosyltransferase involved in cell wall biosynthesis
MRWSWRGSLSAERSYDDDQLRVLSVGRVDREKNPLLLADALAGLRAVDSRWRLVVCGEGPMEPALEQRLSELGLTEHAELLGYTPLHAGLLDVYRSSHVFLHVSLTEGMPQVLIEAFASGVPIVATAVGGVAEAAGDAALLIPPSDPVAATAAVLRVAREPDLRRDLIAAGLRKARAQTLERELTRVSEFIKRAGPGG